MTSTADRDVIAPGDLVAAAFAPTADWAWELTYPSMIERQMWRFAFTDCMEALEWDTAGYTPHTAKKWARWCTPPETDAWITAGFEYTNVSGWVTGGFTPTDAVTWRAAGFAPEDAATWRSAGVATPTEALVWSRRGVSAGRYREWRNDGVDPEAMIPWLTAGVTFPKAARAWQRRGFTPVQAQAWSKIGMNAGLAEKWETRPDRMPDDTVRWWRSRFDDEQLTPGRVRRAEKAGITATTADRWVAVLAPGPHRSLLSAAVIAASVLELESATLVSAAGIDLVGSLDRVSGKESLTAARGLFGKVVSLLNGSSTKPLRGGEWRYLRFHSFPEPVTVTRLAGHRWADATWVEVRQCGHTQTAWLLIENGADMTKAMSCIGRKPPLTSIPLDSVFADAVHRVPPDVTDRYGLLPVLFSRGATMERVDATVVVRS